MTKKAKDYRLPKLCDGVILREEDFGLLVFNPKTDVVLEANRIGAEILRYCDGKCRISEISEQIARTFKINVQVASRDIKSFIVKLNDIGLTEYA